MKRAGLFVDGFNLYHSLHNLGNPELKWLSLRALGEKILPQKSEELVWIGYFSAIANQLRVSRPESIQRHLTYIDALEATHVQVVLGNFKRKSVRCRACKHHWIRHEEKETDVSIAIHLVAMALTGEIDVAYVLSADTDLAPAFEMLSSRAKGVEIVSVLPPVAPGERLFAAALTERASRVISLSESNIRAARFEDTVMHPSRGPVSCPAEYRKDAPS